MQRILATLLTVASLGLFPPDAWAIKEFKKAFQQRYIDGSHDEDFKKAFRKAACNTCHVKGEKKDVCNSYGQALGKLIEGNAEARLKQAQAGGNRDAELKKVLAELAAAFDEVEQMKNPGGQLYGQLLHNGQLPVPLPAEPPPAPR